MWDLLMGGSVQSDDAPVEHTEAVELGDWRRVKSSGYRPDGSIRTWYEYEYDANDNRIKRTYYNADGSISRWEEYVWQYFANAPKSKK